MISTLSYLQCSASYRSRRWELWGRQDPVSIPQSGNERLDRFVRQSMQIDFEQFVEAPSVPPRLSQGGNKAEFPDDGRICGRRT